MLGHTALLVFLKSSRVHSLGPPTQGEAAGKVAPVREVVRPVIVPGMRAIAVELEILPPWHLQPWLLAVVLPSASWPR